jgi:NADP-dependent 3-hydroxy acid dehydrogenase YdfG
MMGGRATSSSGSPTVPGFHEPERRPLSAAEPLADRSAVVTGASRGIGLATARLLAAAGAQVIMLARGAEALAAEAARLGARGIPLAADLANPEARRRAIAAIGARLGEAPDILVNNAGLFRLAPVAETSPDDFALSLEVNLRAPFELARAFLPGMHHRGHGHVVTVGSIADRATFPENAAYAAGKFGVRALHQVMREELRGSGVRATLVSPGPVDTPLWDTLDPDARSGFTPRARMLPADAVAAAILYAVTQPATVNVDELRLSRS